MRRHFGKAAFLEKITSRAPSYGQSVNVSEKMDGSSPPTVFIGRFGYPKVFVGPMLPPFHGDTKTMDTPEEWRPSRFTSNDIAQFRLQLVRGKKAVGVNEENKFIDQMREIALSARPVEVEASFEKKPVGGFFHEEVQPFGPSAALKTFEANTGRLDDKLEKAWNDTDWKARDAMLWLYENNVEASSVMRALSVGALGEEKNRKLVPTRWSITAFDSTVSENLLEQVKQFPLLENCRIYESYGFHNRFLVILFPSTWQYEWIEAFFPTQPGDKLAIFSDHESFMKKTQYSSVGGCYYSARLGAAERLVQEQKQAGVLILREAYENYIPLGVWNCRELVREAVNSKPLVFENFKQGLDYAVTRLRIPKGTWREYSSIMRENAAMQTTLSQSFCPK